MQPNSSANVDEHVLISLSTYRWDDDVIFKNCARDDDRNKVRTYCVCVQSCTVHYGILSHYVFVSSETTACHGNGMYKIIVTFNRED